MEPGRKGANTSRPRKRAFQTYQPQISGAVWILGDMPPHALGELLCHAGRLKLPVEGLMCIPPHDEDAAPHFALLAKLARDHGLKTLSMGMSGDFELAVKFGATHVRVGSAIFGARPSLPAQPMVTCSPG